MHYVCEWLTLAATIIVPIAINAWNKRHVKK